jgi:small conductance mechanosensitive channel
MSSLTAFLNDSVVGVLLRLLIIAVAALLLNRAARALCNRLVRPAAVPSRSEQAREQRTRALADLTYKAASAAVWVVAALMALRLTGIDPLPALAVVVVVGVAAGIAAQNLLRDVVAGFYVVLEDQYVIGETVQIGAITGRVEQLTLRRTVLRDGRGALVTIANGEIRNVANLNRDWSQAFVDVALAPEIPLEKPLAALESAAAELRNDPAWLQALIDGPRVLGVHALDRNASVLRMQVRTLPMRQEEISRELRRRIQLELQKQGVATSSILRCEVTNAATVNEVAAGVSH